MYRLGARVRLELDPPFASAFVEVDTVVSHVVAARAASYTEAFHAATDEELPALAALYGYAVMEARPVWDFVDHLGPVPVTAQGWMRLPLKLGLAIVADWLETLDTPDPVVAAGPDGGGLGPGLSDAQIAAKKARRGR